jgi:hypothetical protein
MKSNENKKQNKLAGKLLLLSGVLLVAAAAAGAGFFAKSIRQLDAGQRDEAALNRVLEARMLNVLIQEINTGHEAEARKYLNIMMASDTREAKLLAASADPVTGAEVKVALAQFAKAEKAHPGYYSITDNVKPAGNMQIARHVPTQ